MAALTKSALTSVRAEDDLGVIDEAEYTHFEVADPNTGEVFGSSDDLEFALGLARGIAEQSIRGERRDAVVKGMPAGKPLALYKLAD
jgi:hypothetical protein